MLGLFFVENDSVNSFVTRCAVDDLTLSTAYLPASRTLESFIFPDKVSILTTRADSCGTRDISLFSVEGGGSVGTTPRREIRSDT